MEFLPLHEHKQYEDECAEVLNEEWPRSKGARLHALQKSSDSFPYCIVMVEGRTDGPGCVLGHSRLCLVHGQREACFVESVIIKKSLRGKGYGRKLMAGTEDIAKRLGFLTCYLTTHDKQDFYSHVGYTYCDPIISLGGASNLLSSEMITKLLGPGNCQQDGLKPLNKQSSISIRKIVQNGNQENVQAADAALLPSSPLQLSPSTPPPPPPPPLPPSTSCLPRPPLPPTPASETTRLLPVRLNPSQVFWMKKEL